MKEGVGGWGGGKFFIFEAKLLKNVVFLKLQVSLYHVAIT